MNEKLMKKNPYWIPIILILMYFFIGEFKNILYFNSIIWLGSLIISLMIFLKLNGRFIVVSIENIVWILVWIFFIVIRNQNIKHGIDYGILYYAFMIILMILLKKSTDWIECMVKFLYFICMTHAIITIISYFVPSLYMNFIVPIVGSEYRNDVIRLYNNGCMAGITSHYSINGMYLGIGTGIVCVISMFDKNIGKLKKIIAPIVMVIGLLLTGKRAQLVFMIISLFIVYLVYNRKKMAQGIMRIVFAIIVIIILYFIIATFIPGVLVVYERLVESDYSTFGGRTQLYNEAIQMFKHSPIIGNGWGGYKDVIQYSIGLNYSSEYARMNAHNIYLQLLAETGLIGFGCFVSLMMYNLKITINTIKTLLKDNYGIDYLLTSTCVMLFLEIFFILYGFTGNPLYDAIMYIPYFMSCAAVSSIRYKVRHTIILNRDVIDLKIAFK